MFISKNMKLEVFTVILLVSSIILIFGVIGPVSAATITVNPGQSIQSAINSASNDDTIIVNTGIYNENIVVNKKITLIANGNVDIIAGDNQDPVIRFVAQPQFLYRIEQGFRKAQKEDPALSLISRRSG